MEAYLHSFLSSADNKVFEQAHDRADLSPGETAACIHWSGG